MNSDARRDPRFQVPSANLVTVSVKRTATDLEPDISGVLLDLSRGGLRLKLDRLLTKGERLQLVILASQLDCRIHADATVRWAEPDAGEHWIVGCDLTEQIAQESIDELATAGVLERRNDHRRPISFMAEARAELEAGFKPVQIVDISDGGFCAVADDLATKPNDRLLVRIKGNCAANSGFIRARVTWLNDLEGGQTMGCSFLTKADHALMQTISHHDNVDDAEVAGALDRRITKWSMVGAAVLVIIFVQCFLLRM